MEIHQLRYFFLRRCPDWKFSHPRRGTARHRAAFAVAANSCASKKQVSTPLFETPWPICPSDGLWRSPLSACPGHSAAGYRGPGPPSFELQQGVKGPSADRRDSHHHALSAGAPCGPVCRPISRSGRAVRGRHDPQFFWSACNRASWISPSPACPVRNRGHWFAVNCFREPAAGGCVR